MRQRVVSSQKIAWSVKTVLKTRKLIPGQVPQQVLDMNLAKNQSKSQKTENSWKFVYILAKQCKFHFNLTIFFDKKYENSNFAQIWDFHKKLSIQNLLGHPV